MIFRVLLILTSIFAVFFYLFFGIKTTIPQQSIGTYNLVGIIIGLVFLSGIFMMVIVLRNGFGVNPLLTNSILTSNFIILIPVFIMSILLLWVDLGRLIYSIYLFFSDSRSIFPLISAAGIFYKIILLSGLLFGVLILFGATFGKYWYKVHEVDLYFKDLPEQFDGFKVVQISDIHTGSFDFMKGVEHGVEMVNRQNPDIIAFSGDLVNSRASEAIPYIPVFKKLSAKYGKFAVLGNHDYAVYGNFDSVSRVENKQQLLQIHKDMGFKTLNNESAEIVRKGSSIYVCGVENWGLPPFPAFGDIEAALSITTDKSFKILLSHDPSHWDEQVVHSDKNVQLTLSGHTHGMQFGIDLPWLKLSPVSLKYPKWTGLFENEGKYLYVNLGFGFIGYPGRVGIRPEITVIKLHSTSEK